MTGGILFREERAKLLTAFKTGINFAPRQHRGRRWRSIYINWWRGFLSLITTQSTGFRPFPEIKGVLRVHCEQESYAQLNSVRGFAGIPLSAHSAAALNNFICIPDYSSFSFVADFVS